MSASLNVAVRRYVRRHGNNAMPRYAIRLEPPRKDVPRLLCPLTPRCPPCPPRRHHDARHDAASATPDDFHYFRRYAISPVFADIFAFAADVDMRRVHIFAMLPTFRRFRHSHALLPSFSFARLLTKPLIVFARHYTLSAPGFTLRPPFMPRRRHLRCPLFAIR